MKCSDAFLKEFIKANFEEIKKEIEANRKAEAAENIRVEKEQQEENVWPKSQGPQMNVQKDEINDADVTPAKQVDKDDAILTPTPATAETRMSSVNESQKATMDVIFATPAIHPNRQNNLFAQIGANKNETVEPPR